MTDKQWHKWNGTIESELDELIDYAKAAKDFFKNIQANGPDNAQTSMEAFTDIFYEDIPRRLEHISYYWDKCFEKEQEQ